MNAPSEQARRHFETGVAHFESGQLEPAEAAFRAALELAPERPSVLANLGITLFHLGRREEAAPLLEKATHADPAQGEAWIYLGLCREAAGAWGPAADALEEGLAQVPPQAGLWFSFGQCVARLGHPKAALDAYERALDIDPAFAPAWSARGSVLRDLYRFGEAAQCFEQAIAHGGDRALNTYYLAAVRGDRTPPTPPRQYVEGLFDDYSTDFEEHLVKHLRYRGHERLLTPLLEDGRRFAEVIDLGCGTGLCGRLLAGRADAVDGVDLSAAMLEQARRNGHYRDLAHADITHYLAKRQEPAELVLAADVFIYVGELDAVFAEVRRLLRPGGCFAFTAELPEGRDTGFHLLPSLRYGHSEAYLRDLAARHGFTVHAIRQAPLREHAQEPIEALYVYLTREP